MNDVIHVSALGCATFDLLPTEIYWDAKTPSANLHEPWVITACAHFIKPGDNCIDAGANLGYHTLVMAKMVGPSGSVLALEPDPAYFKQLNDNLALNDIHNVDALEVGLWHERAELDFTAVKNSGGASCIGGLLVLNGMDSKQIKVKVVALDDLLMPGLPIRLVKIDCEGAEGNILLGMQDLLRRGVDCVLVELHKDRMPVFKASQYIIRKLMASFGYYCYLLTEDCHRPTLLTPEADVFADRVGVTAYVMFTTPQMLARARDA